MRKIFLALCILLITSTCSAGTISITTLSGDSGIAYQFFNDSFNTIKNVINGNIESINIKDNTISSEDIAISANPLKRDGENIGEYVYSGGTIASGAVWPASSTLTAMVAYIQNDSDGYLHRVQTADINKVFTKSKDTWVFMSYTGAPYYDEVPNGDPQPSTPSNYMLLAKVVSDGTSVTSVTDYRSTSPANLRIYADYKFGLTISRDSVTVSAVDIGPGEIDFGTTVSSGRRRNTSLVKVDLSTTGVGGLDAGSQASETYYYIFAVADPDNSANYKGIASLSSTDATGVTNEKLVGWCYTQSASVVSPDSCGAYKGRGGDAPNIAKTSRVNVLDSYAAGEYETTVAILRFVSSGRPCQFNYSVWGIQAGANRGSVVLSVDSVAISASERGSQWHDTIPLSAGGSHIATIAAGERKLELRIRPQTNTFVARTIHFSVEEK